MPQVFGCPNCQNPFQVPDNAAGQAFQCPTCQTTVEVPDVADSSEAPVDATPPQQDPAIFYCPLCSGQFGVDESMFGQQVTCPHCEELVAIGDDEAEPNATPPFNTEAELSNERGVEEEPVFEAVDGSSSIKESESEPEDGQRKTVREESVAEEPLPPQEPVFEVKSVDHLMPPRCDVPDPKRFPTRLGSDEVILPDGDGGYQSVDANIVTITHNGQIYQLKRLTPEQRQRRKTIHNTITIGIAFVLIYFTLRVLGVFS